MNTTIAITFGLFLGIIMCIPIGPINIISINTTLENNRMRALCISLGGSIMDFFYFAIILNGLTIFTFNETVTKSLKLIGICVIFSMGMIEVIKYLRRNKDQSKGTNINFDKRATDNELELELKLSEKTSFLNLKNQRIFQVLLGVTIYISNPTLLATMSGLSAFVKSTHFFEINYLTATFFALGAAMGSFTWFYFLTYFVEKNKKKFSTEIIQKLNLICGILIVIASGVMSFKLFLI